MKTNLPYSTSKHGSIIHLQPELFWKVCPVSTSLAIRTRPLFWTSPLFSDDSQNAVNPSNPRKTHNFDIYACSADSCCWKCDRWTEMAFWTPTVTANHSHCSYGDLLTRTPLGVCMLVTAELNAVFKIFRNRISVQALWEEKTLWKWHKKIKQALNYSESQALGNLDVLEGRFFEIIYNFLEQKKKKGDDEIKR